MPKAVDLPGLVVIPTVSAATDHITYIRGQNMLLMGEDTGTVRKNDVARAENNS